MSWHSASRPSGPRATRTTRWACRSPCCASAPSMTPRCSRWGCTSAARSATSRRSGSPDRHRHRGPAGPPLTDRVDRGDRGGEGGARGGASGGRRRRCGDPQCRRPARAADGGPHAGPGGDLWLRRTSGRASGRLSSPSASTACASGSSRRPVGEASIPPLGRLAVHNALAAAAVGLNAGLPLDAIVPGLAAASTAPHRSVVIRAGGVTIVDDAYNASPGSMIAALELLAGLPGRHAAVLGEMRELGAEHEAGHRAAGAAAGRTLSLLVVVDGQVGGAALGRGGAGSRPAPDRGGRAVAGRCRRRSGAAGPSQAMSCSVKASRGVELERAVEGLVAALGGPEDAA